MIVYILVFRKDGEIVTPSSSLHQKFYEEIFDADY